MSEFSDYLSKYMDAKGMIPATLANSCGIHRSSLVHMKKGQRAPNDAQLQSIMEHLMMTPSERKRMLDLYRLLRTGEKVSRRRKRMEKMIESMNDLEIPKKLSLQAGYEHTFTEEEYCSVIYGETKINQMVRAILEMAAQGGGVIRLVVQPSYEFLFDCLASEVIGENEQEITHILCLVSNGPQEDNHYNLDCVDAVLRCSMVHSKYRPLFYYGETQSHFGRMSLFPYLVLTEDCALEISADLQYACFTRMPSQIEMFSLLFDEMEKQCEAMMSNSSTVSSMFSIYQNAYHGYQKPCSLSSGLCLMPFLDEKLIRSYLNRQIENFEQFVLLIDQYSENLRCKFRKEPFTWIMEERGLHQFIATGYIPEFPISFYERPLALSDRIKVLEKICAAIEEGWCIMHLLPKNAKKVSDNWEVFALNERETYFHYNTVSEAKIYQFIEASISYSIHDYLQSLREDKSIISAAETQKLIEKLIGEVKE